MSVELMSSVFKADIPEIAIPDKYAPGGTRRVSEPTLKLVLLALADHANDDGEATYPSQKKIERKTGLVHASVNAALVALQQEGYILRIGESKKGTTEYEIDAARLVRQRHKLEGGSTPAVLGQSASDTTLVHQADTNHPLTKLTKGEVEKEDSSSGLAVMEAALDALEPISAERRRTVRGILRGAQIEMQDHSIRVSGLGPAAVTVQATYGRAFERALVGVLEREYSVSFEE